jgi:hypothetical protein
MLDPADGNCKLVRSGGATADTWTMKCRPSWLNKTALTFKNTSILKDFSSEITRPQTPTKVSVDGEVNKKSNLENYNA